MDHPLSHLSALAARGKGLIGAFAFRRKFEIVSLNSGVLRLSDCLGNISEALFIAS